MQQGTAAVTTFREGCVAVIQVNEPPANALSQAVRQGLIDAVRHLGAEPSVEAIVITGVRQRFIAGADLREMSLPPEELFLPDVVAALEAVSKPLVSAISGPALGGGLEIALACDLRLATPGALVGLPETRLGLIPGAGGTQRLPRLVGTVRAIELIGEARILQGQEALDAGIVDRLVAEDVTGAAIAIAATTAKRRLSELAFPPGNAVAEEVAADVAIKRAKNVPSVAEAVALIRSAATVPFAEGQRTFADWQARPEAAAIENTPQ